MVRIWAVEQTNERVIIDYREVNDPLTFYFPNAKKLIRIFVYI